MDPEYKKYIEAEWNANRITRPSFALNNLKLNTREFLRKHPISNVFDCAAHGVTNACIMNNADFGFRPGSILRTKNMHSAEAFTIQNSLGRLGEGHMFSVHGVHMTPGATGPSWYLLDNSAPDIMLTAKLTGCTFIARAAVGQPAGCVEVTHLQPSATLPGTTLHTNSMVPGQSAYGSLKYDIDVRSINVIGVRRGSQWKIYVQKLEKHRLAVLSVHRIFPV